MTALILGADTMCKLANTNAFNQTPIKLYNNKVGYVYVKAALCEQYLADANWSTISSQIRKIEDFPEVLEGWE